MSTMLYQVVFPSSETRFSGILVGAFGIEMTINQKRLTIADLSGVEVSLKGKIKRKN